MTLADNTNRLDQNAQPAGVPAHGASRGGSSSGGTADQQLFTLHERLCELVPEPAERAALLNLPVSVDQAWRDGRMMPVLRAQRKAIQAVVDRLEYDAS